MTVKTKWIVADCWIASFDILGFKNLVNLDGDSFEAICIQEDYEETLGHLESTSTDYHPGDIDYCWLSDTFVMFSPDDSAKSYTVIQQAAKHFIEKCIYSQVPIRGALSVGSFIRSEDNRSLMGNGFIDAFIYGEDQNWLGFLLTPKAIKKVRSYGLEPSRHDFVCSDEVPMRKCNATEVMAYRFQNGAANFSSPLLSMLGAMKSKSGEEYRVKYEKTMNFIEKYYRYIQEKAAKNGIDSGMANNVTQDKP